MSNKDKLLSIKQYLNFEFKKSTIEYVQLGLRLLHENRKSHVVTKVQSAIGNLSISVEFLLKCFLISKNPALVFLDLPLELKIIFLSPEPIANNNWRRYDLELRSFAYKTIELNDAVAAFKVYFPEDHQKLQAHFKLLSQIRNKSLHSVLPSFQKYDLERMGYLVITLNQILRPPDTLQWYSLKPDDEKFLTSFNELRIQKVHERIEKAKANAKRLTTPEVSVDIDHSWEAYVGECPICRSEGVLTGSTDATAFPTGPEYDDFDQSLDFIADGFECDECGLKLDDFEELRLAGLDTYYNRSDEFDKWVEDHAGWDSD